MQLENNGNVLGTLHFRTLRRRFAFLIFNWSNLLCFKDQEIRTHPERPQPTPMNQELAIPGSLEAITPVFPQVCIVSHVLSQLVFVCVLPIVLSALFSHSCLLSLASASYCSFVLGSARFWQSVNLLTTDWSHERLSHKTKVR